MRGFNLSRFAVGHPTLMLFFILMLAAAGAMSFMRLGRAEDPDFTIKVAIVSAQWPGATAAEMRDQVADPIEKKLQELPFFDKVETYTTSGFMAATVTFRDNTPPEPGARSLLPDAQEARRPEAQPAAGGARAAGQRRVRRRLLGPLHADRRRADARPAEGLRRGHPPAAARRAGRQQGRPDRHPGRADLRRVQPRQARHARDQPAGDLREPGAAERGDARRRLRDRRDLDPAPDHRRARRRGRGRGGAGGGRRPGVPPRRHRHRDPRPRRPAGEPRARGRPAGDRRRHLHGRERQHHRARACARRGDGRGSRRTCRWG